MKGFCHSAERCGTVDGPGMRYVLFLAGCNLRCQFCHNPDTWRLTDGSERDVADILQEYERYRAFYDASGGGLTISGGEPLLQPEFAGELLAAARKRGIHTMIDTAGHYPSANLHRVLPHLNAAMFSIKSPIAAKHRLLCGSEPDQSLENLRRLADSVSLTLRYVLIPGLTDEPDDLTALAKLQQALPNQPPIELLPYHSLGRAKWQALKLNYPLTAADCRDSDLQRAVSHLQSLQIPLCNS